jgi:hypothetical protein
MTPGAAVITPHKTARLAASCLMPAFKLTKDVQSLPPDWPDIGSAFTTVGKERRMYALHPESSKHVRKAARRVKKAVGTYPSDELSKKLRELLALAVNDDVSVSMAHQRLSNDVLSLISTLTNYVEWEVVHCVRGISVDGMPFSCGRTDFKHVDAGLLRLWAQRYSAGLFTPQPNTPINRTFLKDFEWLSGQIVASVRVAAADNAHANTEAEATVEESLNLLRYGQLLIGWPPHPAPEAGAAFLGQRAITKQFALQMPLAGPLYSYGEVAQSEGAALRYCKIAPAWHELDRLLQVPKTVEQNCKLGLQTCCPGSARLRWRAIAQFDSYPW